MKVRFGALRRLVREVAMSPTIFQNNQPVRDPMDRPSIAKAVSALEEPFRRGIEVNLVLEARDSYNEETRELDDSAYRRIKEVSDKATEMMMARVHKAVQGAWAEAMKGVEGAERPAPASSKRVAA